jgi:hypothetical protein
MKNVVVYSTIFLVIGLIIGMNTGGVFMDAIISEFLLLMFMMLLVYALSFKYFGIIWIIGIITAVVVALDFVALSALFDSTNAGGLFWICVLLYLLMMPLFKTMMFYEKWIFSIK